MTNKTKHTPGPWLYESGRVVSATSQPIAKAYREMGDFQHNIEVIYPVERDCNMRLIAAAPEMLEALEHVLKDFQDKKPLNAMGATTIARLIKQAKGE